MTEPPEPEVRVVTAARLRARGTSPEQIRARIRKGELLVIARGVYVPRAIVRAFDPVPNGSHVLRAAGSIVLAGPGSVISHQSAALLHDIAMLDSHDADVSVTARGGRRGHRHGVHRYSTPLPPAHVTRRFGLPVTTVARTVVDLARTLTFAEGVVAADSALFRGLALPIDLWAVAADCRHSWGGVKADRVVKFATAFAESPLESLARVVFAEAKLPPPELQIPIHDGDQFIGRVDFLWRKYKLIVEVDGGVKYSDPQRARTQLWRDKALRAAGYEVIHVNWAEITRHPEQVVAEIRAALRARGARYPAA
ncbi:MAG: type IV toxin-antitoxin system AbiEi family antitoxin domain-containing protein [Streptosporangiaceae bacterium]